MKLRIHLSQKGSPSPVSGIRRRLADNYVLFSKSPIFKMNAVQAIESPPGQICISAVPDQTSRQAVITVEDTGVGIPEDHFNQIFDPFFTTKPVGTGTGMGLSVVYGIIQKHQSTISVESNVGEGTRFSIRLPLQQSA